MSKRLQVILTEEELASIRDDARMHRVSVSEWVRRSLRNARRDSSGGDPARKLAAIRAATQHGFPTADIDQMLEEIEAGYDGP